MNLCMKLHQQPMEGTMQPFMTYRYPGKNPSWLWRQGHVSWWVCFLSELHSSLNHWCIPPNTFLTGLTQASGDFRLHMGRTIYKCLDFHNENNNKNQNLSDRMLENPPGLTWTRENPKCNEAARKTNTETKHTSLQKWRVTLLLQKT